MGDRGDNRGASWADHHVGYCFDSNLWPQASSSGLITTPLAKTRLAQWLYPRTRAKEGHKTWLEVADLSVA